MDVSRARIGDRFRKGDTRNRAIKKKMKMLQSFVNFIQKKHSHAQEKARRRRQIERGFLKVTQ